MNSIMLPESMLNSRIVVGRYQIFGSNTRKVDPVSFRVTVIPKGGQVQFTAPV